MRSPSAGHARMGVPRVSFTTSPPHFLTAVKGRTTIDVVMAKTDEQVFSEITERLTVRFSDVPSATISNIIGDTRNLFSDSKIRDFVPLLVERRVARHLSTISAA